MMASGSILVRGFRNNSIFDLEHSNNRDNCLYPYFLLRSLFLDKGIKIDTADLADDSCLSFSIHSDVQDTDKDLSSYLMLFETQWVYKRNGNQHEYANYKLVFTWDDTLVDNIKFFKINFPNPMRIGPIDGFNDRDIFCTLISSNRSLDEADRRILYPERVNVIRWFEKNAPTDFHLYGNDWNMPVLKNNISGKIERRLWRLISKYLKVNLFPSYRGKVSHKREILDYSRFSFCYENVCDLPGYITEKIFDSFFSGCVPVYWGASNITDHIPSDCFIDRRQFADTAAVYTYLKAITEAEFKAYQLRIKEFLQSNAAHPFSSEYFAETIVNTIVQDLGLQS